ncbi:MAG: PDZ domain-containing protein [Thermoanaerobaculia bacterium]
MNSRFNRAIVVFAVVASAAAAMHAEESKRCNSSARECEQQIRQMLAGRRYLGVQVVQLNPAGLMIKNVVADSPASHAELKEGDRIVAVNGHSMTEAKIGDFKEILAASKAGTLFLIVERQGAMRKFDLRMEPYTKSQIDKIVAAHLASSHPEVAAGSQK